MSGQADETPASPETPPNDGCWAAGERLAHDPDRPLETLAEYCS